MFWSVIQRVFMRWLLLPALAMTPGVSGAAPPVTKSQETLSPRLAELARDLAGGKSNALSDFWHEVEGKTPLVERIPGNAGHRIVTFLWRGEDKSASVNMIGGLPSANLTKPLTHWDNTDLWYLTETHPTDARFEYGFQVNGPSPDGTDIMVLMRSMGENPPRLDPLNPRQFEGRSYVELPDAPLQPWIAQKPKIPHGKVTHRSFKSKTMNAEYPVTVYAPPGYGKQKQRCWLMIAFDGGFPLMENTLDNLLAAGKIPPMIVVGVGNVSGVTRNRDLIGSATFAKFLATELVPWARKNYNVYSDPSHTIVEGISLGGLMAVYCGLKRSETFGKVLAQSPTLIIPPGKLDPNPIWTREDPGMLAHQFVKGPRLPVEFYLEAGRHEVYLPFSLLTETRHLRDVLEAKGYRVTYSEFDGGHNGVCWRGSIADALIALTARRRP